MTYLGGFDCCWFIFKRYVFIGSCVTFVAFWLTYLTFRVVEMVCEPTDVFCLSLSWAFGAAGIIFGTALALSIYLDLLNEYIESQTILGDIMEIVVEDDVKKV